MRLFKTALGQTAFKERSPLFSARQRSLFILFDGKKTLGDVLLASAGLGMAQADVDYLLSLGFLSPESGELPPDSASAPLEVISSPTPLSSAEFPVDPATEQQRYFDAKPLATQLTASLGLRGFMLNLAVEGADGYPQLLKLLPRIQEAVGAKACRKLERILLGQSQP